MNKNIHRFRFIDIKIVAFDFSNFENNVLDELKRKQHCYTCHYQCSISFLCVCCMVAATIMLSLLILPHKN